MKTTSHLFAAKTYQMSKYFFKNAQFKMDVRVAFFVKIIDLLSLL